MRRYLISLLLLLALATAALVGPHLPANAARAGASTITPQGIFAEDVLARRRLGWQLVDYAIGYDDDHEDAALLHVTLADGDEAERFTLTFREGGERAVAYAREVVAVPPERRIYPGEASLFEALASRQELRLEAGCSDYYLEAGKHFVGINPFDYYVITETATGREARRKLATTLASAIGAGMEVTAVRSSDGPDGRWVEIALADGTGLTVRARVDEGGEVVAMESRTTPNAYAWERIRDAGKLARSLRRASTEVRAIAFDEESGRLTLSLDGRRHVRIDTTDVEESEHADEGDCGC